MKYQCDLVQDLLPLYEDNICSKTSRDIVEEHLQECDVCRKAAEQMKDYTVEDKLTEEKNTVIYEHEKKVRKRTTTIGVATAGILLIPVIVCLICNLVIGHALDWFFIVLTALLLVASLIVVPLLVEKRRFLWTMVCSLVSLILLLMTCCIYTNGNWFWVASTACVFGLSVVFAMFVIRELPLGQRQEKHKGCLVLLWDSFWLYLLLAVCGIYVHGDELYWRTAASVSTYVLMAVWIWFLVIRYWKKNAWMKVGLLTMVTGLWFGLTNNIVGFFIPGAVSSGLENLDLTQGFSTSDYDVLNANILFTVIVVSVCVGAVWMWLGSRKGKHDANKKED